MDYKIITETGSRKVNEDCAGAELNGDVSCFVLCDGLGGHGMGEVASEIVTSALLEHFRSDPDMSDSNISAAFEYAQEKLLDRQEETGKNDAMKTTATLLIAGNGIVKAAHIGDSRIYLFNRNKIVYRSLDHSVPQMLALAGDIKESQIRKHPDRNRLLRVMGMEWGSRKYEIAEPRPAGKCQAALMCSDGFWEYITEDTMCRFLKKSSSAEEWMDLMLEEVEKNGQGENMDNHTAIAVIF